MSQQHSSLSSELMLSSIKNLPGDFRNFSLAFLIACNRSMLEEFDEDKMWTADCYAVRAHQFLIMRFFSNCMNSLKLAESIHHSDETTETLREKCTEMMKKFKDMSANPYANKFKLSYSVNRKLPFFIDALDVSKDFIFGKVLMTKQNLKAGDVIAEINDPWIAVTKEMRGSLCFNCMRNNNFDLERFPELGTCEFLL